APKTRSTRRGDRVVNEMRWRIDAADAAPGSIVAARLASCRPAASAGTAEMTLEAISHGRRVTYRQRLFPSLEGPDQTAAVDPRRAFADPSVRLTGVDASCDADSASDLSGSS